MNYPLTSSTWGQEELDAIQRVISSGRFTMGEEVAAFEREFADYFGSAHAVMVNSGSSANLVGIAALCYKRDKPLQRGDEVIVPAVSWATTYHPLQQYGLKLRFVDVNPSSLNIDTYQLKHALTPRTRMVMVVHVLGNPADMNGVDDWFCQKHGLYLFEDNCESMGAGFGVSWCGTFGHIGTFSMFYSHHISTMEGGMIVTDDQELADLCRIIRNHGWDRQPNAGFFDAYRFVMPGYNVRPIEMAAAVGREQLKNFVNFDTHRQRNARLFKSLFGADPRFILQHETGRSSWFAFTFIVRPHVDRDAILKRLSNAGIEHRMITGGCFTRHEAIKYFDYETVGDLPMANMVHDRGFFVGNHPRDLTAELHYLRDVLA